MIAKIWKNVLLVILLICCLFNIVTKLVKKQPLEEELKASVQYIEKLQNKK